MTVNLINTVISGKHVRKRIYNNIIQCDNFTANNNLWHDTLPQARQLIARIFCTYYLLELSAVIKLISAVVVYVYTRKYIIYSY